MAAIAFCPACGLEMDVPPDLAGGLVECPACGKEFGTQPLSEGDDQPPPRIRIQLAQNSIRSSAIALFLAACVIILVSGIVSTQMLIDIATGNQTSQWFFALLFALDFIRGVLVAYGAWRLLRADSLFWAKLAAMLMLVPTACACSPCTFWFWFFNLFFGLWAITIIMTDPHVKWLIRHREREIARLGAED